MFKGLLFLAASVASSVALADGPAMFSCDYVDAKGAIQTLSVTQGETPSIVIIKNGNEAAVSRLFSQGLRVDNHSHPLETLYKMTLKTEEGKKGGSLVVRLNYTTGVASFRLNKDASVAETVCFSAQSDLFGAYEVAIDEVINFAANNNREIDGSILH